METIFQGTNITLNFNGNDTILVDDEAYLHQLADLLSTTNLSIVGEYPSTEAGHPKIMTEVKRC